MKKLIILFFLSQLYLSSFSQKGFLGKSNDIGINFTDLVINRELNIYFQRTLKRTLSFEIYGKIGSVNKSVSFEEFQNYFSNSYLIKYQYKNYGFGSILKFFATKTPAPLGFYNSAYFEYNSSEASPTKISNAINTITPKISLKTFQIGFSSGKTSIISKRLLIDYNFNMGFIAGKYTFISYNKLIPENGFPLYPYNCLDLFYKSNSKPNDLFLHFFLFPNLKLKFVF